MIMLSLLSLVVLPIAVIVASDTVVADVGGAVDY